MFKQEYRETCLCLFGVLTLGLAGCGGIVAPQSASTLVPIETALPTVQAPSLVQTPPPTPTVGPITWRRISDAWYKYSFEVPSGWHEDRDSTTDRLVFFSDPSPDGLMKLDFSADPSLKYGRDLRPDLTGMSPITVAGRPAWIFSGEGGEAAPSTFVVSAYIAGPEYWYYLWLGCTPSGSNAEVRDRFITECRSVMDHILGSFRIAP